MTYMHGSDSLLCHDTGRSDTRPTRKEAKMRVAAQGVARLLLLLLSLLAHAESALGALVHRALLARRGWALRIGTYDVRLLLRESWAKQTIGDLERRKDAFTFTVVKG